MYKYTTDFFFSAMTANTDEPCSKQDNKIEQKSGTEVVNIIKVLKKFPSATNTCLLYVMLLTLKC